jgi:hypothetical protein
MGVRIYSSCTPTSFWKFLYPLSFTTKLKNMDSAMGIINKALGAIPSYEVKEGMVISFIGNTQHIQYNVLETDEHGKYNVLVVCEVGMSANCRFTRSLTDDETVILRD